MIIPILVGPPPSSSVDKLPPTLAQISHSEYILIELQGYLDIPEAQIKQKDGKLVGKLCIEESGEDGKSPKKAKLYIGHHLLEGQIVRLPKPLGILVKGKKGGDRQLKSIHPGLSDDVDEEDRMDEDPPAFVDHDITSSIEEEGSAAWHIVAVVKQKILFSKRPTPLVGKSAKPQISGQSSCG